MDEQAATERLAKQVENYANDRGSFVFVCDPPHRLSCEVLFRVEHLFGICCDSFCDKRKTTIECERLLMTSIRIQYVTPRGAHCMRFTSLAELPNELAKLCRRRIRAMAYVYDARGRRLGEPIGASQKEPFESWVWWCERETIPLELAR